MKDGTYCATLSDRAELEWFNRKYKRTVYYKSANVAVFRSAPRYTIYQAFETPLQSHLGEPRAFSTVHVIPNDDKDDDDVMTNQDDRANNQVAPDHALHSEHQDADNSDTVTRQQSVSSALKTMVNHQQHPMVLEDNAISRM
jgi:hypothetical protein